MKKKILLAAAVVSLMTLYACPDPELTVEEAAAKASKEMCDCLNNKTESECEKDLNSHYGSFVNNDDFYSTFNKVNDCGITIYKTKE